jgi:hypothetical protein
MQPKFTTDFCEPFKKMLSPFPVFMNGFEPSKLGVQLSGTSIGPGDRGSVTSIPKFYHDFKKVNLRVFDRLPRSRMSL